MTWWKIRPLSLEDKTPCFVTASAAPGCIAVARVSRKWHSNKYTATDPFYCVHCSLSQQKKEIESLKATIEKLSSDLLSVNCTMAKFNSKECTTASPTTQLSEQTVGDSSPVAPFVNRPTPSSAKSSLSATKFNIVVRGVPEHTQSTPENGHDWSSIKIRAHSLFLNGRRHGSVMNSAYQLHPTLAELIPSLDQHSNNPTHPATNHC